LSLSLERYKKTNNIFRYEEQEEIKSEFTKLAGSDSGSDSEDEIFSKKAIKSGVATEADIDWNMTAAWNEI